MPAAESNYTSSLAGALLGYLEAMDSACATGLCDYGTFESMPTKIEKALHLGLARRLREDGWEVAVEMRYPSSRKTCDLFISKPNGLRCWIEVKIVWRQWFYERVKRNQASMYRPYFFGPLVPGWKQSHSVAQDTEKLEVIDASVGDVVGILGIGFDSAKQEIVHDLNELAQLARLSERNWNIDSVRCWRDRHSDECSLSCWFWWKPTTASMQRR
jgi:hypothetical protein